MRIINPSLPAPSNRIGTASRRSITTTRTRTTQQSIKILLLATCVLPMWLNPPGAHGQATFTKMHSFKGPDGEWPLDSVVQGTDGNIYGTTPAGGLGWDSSINPSGNGIVFKMTSAGTLTTIYSFTGGSDGGGPGAVVQGTNGNFYGTTQGSPSAGYGPGTIFQITPGGTLTTLYSFTGGSDGLAPGNLVQAIDGDFYGTTVLGGDSGYGTVFKITPDGTLSTLYSFNDPNYGYPCRGALVQGTDGNFYGRVHGWLFKMTPDGTLTNLVSSAQIGCSGEDGNTLVQGADGSFYSPGQSSGFKVTPDGMLTALGTTYVRGLVQGTDGNFYGVGNGETIFRITPNGAFTTLYTFASGVSGEYNTALIQGRDGNFYGTTALCYNCTGEIGYVYRLSVPGAASPKIISTTKSGTTLTLTWLALLGRTYQVQFTSDLARTNWTNLGSSLTATNATVAMSDPMSTDPRRFYRVVLLP